MRECVAIRHPELLRATADRLTVIRCTGFRIFLPLVWLLAATVPVVRLSAQHVSVVLKRADGAPVVGAIVSLEATGDSARVAPALSDDRGAVLLLAPHPGRWRVRADVVGRESWRSAWQQLVAGDTVSLVGRLDTRRTILPAVVIEQRSSCTSNVRQGAAITAAWQEARKAMLASTLAPGAGAPTLRIRRFTRLLSAAGVLRHESADSLLATTTRPFVTARSAEQLAADGYLMTRGGEQFYLAPDAAVLLSDGFAATHCFTLAADRKRPEHIGLAFAPAAGRRLPEIAGTFWLDRASSELRELEYRYVNIGRMAELADAGGRVEFQRLPDGLWIVSAWSVRTPRAGVVRQQLPGGRLAERDTLFGATEEGGAVLGVQPRRTVVSSGPVTISGVVWDSLRRAPLAGARVRALAAGPETTADSAGHYALQLSRGGAVTLQVTHPRLALYHVPTNYDVEAVDPTGNRLDVGIRSGTALRTLLCPADADASPRSATIVGTVSGDRDGRTVGFAALRASWRVQQRGAGMGSMTMESREQSVTAAADSGGRFVFCGLPPDSYVTLQADAPGFETRRDRLRLAPLAVVEHPLHLVPCAVAGAAENCGVAVVSDAAAVEAETADAQQRALVASGAETRWGTVIGVVLGEDGQPLAGAQLEIVGDSARVTAADDGRFRLERIPAGLQVLRARRLGARPRLQTFDVPAGGVIELRVALAPAAVELRALTVTGSASGARPERYASTTRFDEFYRRRQRRIGSFLTRDEIEAMPGASDIGDLLRAIPGVRFTRKPDGTFSVAFPRCGSGGTSEADAKPSMGQGGVALFVDGAQLAIDNLGDFTAADVEALEVYRSASDLPPEAIGNACAAIFIWTRFGG